MDGMGLRKPNGRIATEYVGWGKAQNGLRKPDGRIANGIWWMRNGQNGVFGNQMVELRTEYDGWVTDRTSSLEGNHRELHDVCCSVTWSVTSAIVIFSRINFLSENLKWLVLWSWRIWAFPAGFWNWVSKGNCDGSLKVVFSVELRMEELCFCFLGFLVSVVAATVALG